MGCKKTETTPLEEAYLNLRKRLDLIGSSFRLSKEDAEDVIQEGYLRLSDKEMTDEPSAKGKFWVTIRNIIIDRSRKKKEITSFPIEELTTDEDVDASLEYEFLQVQMSKTLTKNQLNIMKLLVDEGLDYPEIAERLNMKESAVRTTVCRVRKILKERIRL